MQKQFTIRMPDELYVPGFTSNISSSFVYEGPSTISVVVNETGQAIFLNNPEAPPLPEDSRDIVVEIDAEEYPDAAHYLINTGSDHVYEYEDEINHDGSIYKKMTNPRLQDVYQLIYNRGAVVSFPSIDGHTHGPWEFKMILKDRTTHGETLAKKNLQLVKSSLSDVALDTTSQGDYDDFVDASETYLTTMANVLPWKYVHITTPAVPKLPVSLVAAINQVKAVR